ncbi:MAG: TIGR03617 family F420-dependent LLM class oxidoreductase [Deltaproteobacteria bacterium]|nr:TIGR03617 family F420-dependent LLM class oxidoreductase [Deltaproteobacteria bacterium]
MKLDTTLAMGGLDRVGGLAKRAEEMGFAGVFTAEAMQTPFLSHAVAALTTEQIELGTAIAVAFPRSPMIHAMTAWDLQKASKGRFVLGLGAQIRKHNERRFSVPFDPVGPRMRDMLMAIRHIWDAFDGKHPLDYRGEYYTHDYIQPFFNPGPTGFGQPKLFIAAVGPYMCRLAGELCDGIHIHPFHTTRYIEEVVKPCVNEGLARSGRDPASFEYATTAFILGGTDEEREGLSSVVRSQIAFYGSTPAYKRVFEAHGWNDLQPRLNDLVRAGKLAEAPQLVSEEILDEFSVRGSFDAIADQVREKYEGLVDRVGLYIPVVGGAYEKKWERVVQSLAA